MTTYPNLYVEFSTTDADIQSAILTIAEFCQNKDYTSYLVQTPLGSGFEGYEATKSFIWSSPKHGITFVNCGDDSDKFEDFYDDIIEDLGALSAKHEYRNLIGRPRNWAHLTRSLSQCDLTAEEWLTSVEDIRTSELLTSLLIGSINNVTRIGKGTPTNVLDAVKSKVILLDGDQTRFVFDEPDSKTIRIQGLSGTGKTELLLHRLKEIYVNKQNSRIAITCHSKILSGDLRDRIPVFFNFMKVEEQIDWDNRLICSNSWGSSSDSRSGIYRYICSYYQIPFLNLREAKFDFANACNDATSRIKLISKLDFSYAFDYVFIDESQDFSPEFLELCELVTSGVVYLAGDIFQNIFDKYDNESSVDFLLKKCYRTAPSTLTISHALSMGLFENPIIRWLNDDQWKACGYNIIRTGSDCQIGRSPIRRFIDLPQLEIHPPMVVHNYTGVDINGLSEGVTGIVKDILQSHPTAKIDDICILCPLDTNHFYDVADQLSYRLQLSLGHKVNKSYESKKKIDGQLFLSNRNNVKGLEFPFVICLALNMKRSLEYRNSLYMMLTRSLVTTHLVLFKDKDKDLETRLNNAISSYLTSGAISIPEPSEEEQKLANKQLLAESTKLSHYDFVQGIAESLGLKNPDLQSIVETTCTYRPNIFDEAEIKQFIETLLTQSDN